MRGLALLINQPEANVNRIQHEILHMTHEKDCGCPTCSKARIEKAKRPRMTVNEYMKTKSINDLEAAQEAVKERMIAVGSDLYDKLYKLHPDGITNQDAIALLVTLSSKIILNMDHSLSENHVTAMALMNGLFVHMDMCAILGEEMKAKGIEIVT